MHYYVDCKAHRGDRHFLIAPKDAPHREDFPDVFTISGGCTCEYRREDVRAMAGPEIPGAFLFAAEPFVSAWWALTGRMRREDGEARGFNGD